MYEGSKVRLREYRKDDIPQRLIYINDPDIGENLTPDTLYPMTLHEEERWFESITAVSDTYKFAIETLNDEHFIGGCSINGVDWKNRVASIGIFIGDKDYRGKGYGTDAMKVLLNFIFQHMNINKIRLTVYSYNKPAMKCYERLGFMIEGILRQEIYKDGTYYDKIAMGLLREEYLLMASKPLKKDSF